MKPSDEEIKKASKNYSDVEIRQIHFEDGAKWMRDQMSDRQKQSIQMPTFWERLKMFIENVQINDCASEEEKEMILKICDAWINSLPKPPKTKKMKTKEDLDFLERILPSHYMCEERENGFYCKSEIGICDDHSVHSKYNPETDDQWKLIVKAMRQHWGNRLVEINSIEPQSHSKFKIYLQ